ncbi:pentatricopeptide repeat-containing protein At2g13600-like, partial [Aristolochia californica]|uniref:pentatricopeptide repeat-containing protein At2g13600-like n=1 Tax=Aristolochia californica TaxID=171875 RepID=UPI0035D9E52F
LSLHSFQNRAPSKWLRQLVSTFRLSEAASSIFRKWKYRRWKRVKFYSTFYQIPPKPVADVVSWNISITGSVQKGNLDSARNLFDKMPHRTIVSWNTMISGYVKWGRTREALDILSDMHKCGVRLNETSFSTLLGACSRAELIGTAKLIHCVVCKSGHEDFEYVGSALVSCYLSCGEVEDACTLFEMLRKRNVLLWSVMLMGFVKHNLLNDAMDVFLRMPSRDVISWTALISGYSQSKEECKKALDLFHLMTVAGEAEPNEFTLDTVIRACGRMGALSQGKMAHGLVIKVGFGTDCSIVEGLVDFYSKCNAVEEADRIYTLLTDPCVNASNSLIDGFISAGRIKDAEVIFNHLAKPNAISYNLMIKGYGQSGDMPHSISLFEKMPNRTVVSSNTMISMYCQNGYTDEALKLFEETKWEKNIVTWNSMISGYVRINRVEDAFKLYVTMHQLRVVSNRSTFSTLFHGCSRLGALLQGKLLHAHVVKTPFESNVYVGTSLIDMYSKCGSISDAQTVFLKIVYPNVAAWTALLNGYAHHGLGTEATLLFDQMLEHGVRPNAVTFVGLLLVCSRAGLVNEGLRYFDLMKKKYGLVPSLEHYACVVDLLGRSGGLIEAEQFISEMPIKADGVVWAALLSACWFFMDLKVGERVAKRLMSLDTKQISVYVLVSNIYAGLGRWEEVVQVRKKLRNMDVKKDPGCSWIEVNNTVHVFRVEDITHPSYDAIYKVLEELTSNSYCNLPSDYNIVQYDKHENLICYLLEPN